MVKITEQLIRKKAEHNECIINTLEELSLHQENVEKIENIGNWCKNLEILYLQANLISKIENLHKLKRLRYINLAINNIEKIENLEKCESLEKLDLTLNFIGEIEGVCSLKCNVYLKHLYLTGNPCMDFTEYRNFVIANLPQLESLDSQDITRSERITAMQRLNNIYNSVIEDQQKYQLFRTLQKERLSKVDNNISDEEFWKSTSEHAPEVRTEIAKRSRRSNNTDKENEKQTRILSLFTKDGRPLNINQAKLDFTFNDEDDKEYVLDIGVYRYLDTNFIEVDLQPIYVKVVVKGKVFQFVLPEEICINKSTAKRSQTTGRLVLRMPKVKYNSFFVHNQIKAKQSNKKECNKKLLGGKYLEVGTQEKVTEKLEKLCYTNISDIPPLEFC